MLELFEELFLPFVNIPIPIAFSDNNIDRDLLDPPSIAITLRIHLHPSQNLPPRLDTLNQIDKVQHAIKELPKIQLLLLRELVEEGRLLIDELAIDLVQAGLQGWRFGG